MAKITDYPSL